MVGGARHVPLKVCTLSSILPRPWRRRCDVRMDTSRPRRTDSFAILGARETESLPISLSLSCSPPPCPGGRMADRARGDVAVIESNSRRAQGGKVKVTNPLFPPTAFSPHFILALFLPSSTSLCACVRLCRCVLGSSFRFGEFVIPQLSFAVNSPLFIIPHTPFILLLHGLCRSTDDDYFHGFCLWEIRHPASYPLS